MLALKNIPGLRKLVWTMKNYMKGSVLPYNGRWELVKTIIKDLSDVPDCENGKKIIVFASNHMWSEYLILISCFLYKMGFDVTFLWTDSQVEQKNNDLFLDWSLKYPVPQYSRLRFINIDSIGVKNGENDEWPKELEEMVKKVTENDVRYSFKNELLEKTDSENKFYQLRKSKNLEFLRKLRFILRDKENYVAITGNGTFYEMGIFYYFNTLIGKKCVTIDTFELNEGLVVDWEKPSVEWNTSRVWNYFKDIVVSAQCSEYFNADFKRRSSKKTGFQHADVEDGRKVLENMGINNDYPVVLLCGNLVWDSAVLNMQRTFGGIEEAFNKTIAWAENKKINLVIRFHPVEAIIEQPKSLEDRIRLSWPTLPRNVFIISSDQKVSSYSLFPVIKLGIVYTSTIGLEMASYGIPVITLAKSHYSKKGFTFDPEISEEYFNLLDQIYQNEMAFCSCQDVELAKKYYFIYFNYFPKSLPWRFLSLRKDLIDKSPKIFFDKNFPQIYKDTMTFISGESVPSRGWL